MAAKFGCKRQKVRGHDGRQWNSMAEAARALGCSNAALYSYAVVRRGHLFLTRYPDPRNVGMRGGAKQRTRA